MQWELWLAFVGAAIAISVSPGAGAIQSMATGLAYGLRRGYWSITGLQIGLMMQLAAVAVGLGAAVAQSVVAFTVIKWIGVVYLVYLAVRQWRARPLDLGEQLNPRPAAGGWPLLVRGIPGQRHQPQGSGVPARGAAAVRRADRPAAPPIPGHRRDDGGRRPGGDGRLHRAWRPGCWAGCAPRASRPSLNRTFSGLFAALPRWCCRWCAVAPPPNLGAHGDQGSPEQRPRRADEVPGLVRELPDQVLQPGRQATGQVHARHVGRSTTAAAPRARRTRRWFRPSARATPSPSCWATARPTGSRTSWPPARPTSATAARPASGQSAGGACRHRRSVPARRCPPGPLKRGVGAFAADIA